MADKRHISNEAINKVMHAFQSSYLVDQEYKETAWSPDMEELIQFKRNPIKRYAKEWLVHPLKRALGISGKPFSVLLKRK